MTRTLVARELEGETAGFPLVAQVARVQRQWDGNVHDLSALMDQDEEHEQHSKRCGRDREEIDRGDLFRMVKKKGLSRLRRQTRTLGTIFADGRI